jgi:PIN domain nuclease of toxin-antitoxin system
MGRRSLMKLLLDTHIWIWIALEPARLSKKVTSALMDPENELYLSPISVWELVMLTQKGRVELDEDVVSWTTRTVQQWQLQEAPLTVEVALETSRLNLAHSDPSDRLIAASAKLFDMTLVTADEKLIAAQNVKVLANR